MATNPKEDYFRAFERDDKPYVSINLPFHTACANHAASTFHASRIYIIVSNSISKGPNFGELRDALGDKIVGIRYGIRHHTPWTDVLETAREVHEKKADLLITLGAGSLTDGAKVVSFAVGNQAFDEDALSRIAEDTDPKDKPDPSSIKDPYPPIITIPTSLSGGEYNPFAGATDLRTDQKRAFRHPKIGPALIILDPELCTTTPQSVWLASGMRAVDHCVEGLTGVFFSPDSKSKEEERAQAEKAFLEGLKDILPGLLATRKDEKNVEARKRAILGVVATMRGFKFGAPMGASHGIGHQLGPLGVGHGETSCVLLSSVLKWNLEQARRKGQDWVKDRQKVVMDAFYADKDVVAALKKRNLNPEHAALGDVVKAFVQELGLPSSLKDVGVGQDQFDKLAKNALTDGMLKTNPVPITGEEDVKEIIKLAAGAKETF